MMAFKSTGLLLIILLLTLVFSILYPFYSIDQGIPEGIRENMGTSLLSGDIKNIQNALSTYSTKANGNCQKALNIINPLIKGDPQLSMNVSQNNAAGSPVAQPCASVDSINNQSPSDSKIINAINSCYGANYASVLNLLNTINSKPTNDALTNDPNFAKIIKTQTNQPVVSGPQSTYNTIYQYISAAQM
jgi:hypothetical protein